MNIGETERVVEVPKPMPMIPWAPLPERDKVPAIPTRRKEEPNKRAMPIPREQMLGFNCCSWCGEPLDVEFFEGQLVRSCPVHGEVENVKVF